MVAAKRRRISSRRTCRPLGDDCWPPANTSRTAPSPAAKIHEFDELIAIAADERGMRVVEDDDVGRLADGERAGGEAQGLGAAAAGGVEQVPAGGGADGAEPVALLLAQALAVFERAQLLVEGDAHVAVGADGEAAAGGGKARRLEDAVAEIGFGDGAQAGDGAGLRKARALVGRHVRAVDQAPARVDVHVVEQPLHGARAGPGDAVLHLARLLGGVDVDGAGGPSLDERAQLGGIDGAQRMRRDAEGGAGEPIDVAAARLQEPREAVEIEQEARLPRRGRLAAAAAVGIEGRQQRQADAARLGGGDDAAAGLGRVGVVRAVGRVVQVVELADAW